MATWPSDAALVPATENNTFRFNTVENTWRAAGLGIFGGSGHRAHDCILRDVAGQAGIRFNTIIVSNVTLLRTTTTDLWGNRLGAITFQTANSSVHGLRVLNLEVVDSQHHGIYYETANVQPITNVVIHSATIAGSGAYGI
jgi:hypothetical protein